MFGRNEELNLTMYEKTKLNLINDPSVSDWFKAAVIEMDLRDPLDALADAELLVTLLMLRFEDLTSDCSPL